MKQGNTDVLEAIENDFLQNDLSIMDISREEIDDTGLKRWELDFIYRKKTN